MNEAMRYTVYTAPQTFEGHGDAGWAPGHAAGRLALRGLPSQEPLDVAHVVAVDGVCGQTQAGGGVHLGNVHLEHRSRTSACICVEDPHN